MKENGPYYHLNIFTGYLKKYENEWKLAWIQQTIVKELNENDLIDEGKWPHN